MATTLGVGEGIVVSRIGDDSLGARLRQEIGSRGMTDAYLQSDTQHKTGTVQVTLVNREPQYEIRPKSRVGLFRSERGLSSIGPRLPGRLFWHVGPAAFKFSRGDSQISRRSPRRNSPIRL